jgi:antitoxin component of MazEF toxin-antitoxin module
MEKVGSVIQTGNSLALVVPAVFVKKIGVHPGDKVRVKVDATKGTVSYTFLTVRQLPLV